MISLDPVQTFREIETASRNRDSRHKLAEDLVRRFVGNYWASHAQQPEGRPENLIYSTCAIFLPKLVWARPRVVAKSEQPFRYGQLARLWQTATNRVLAINDPYQDLIEAAADYLFSYCVLKVGTSAVQGFGPVSSHLCEHWETNQRFPWISRISPGKFLLDPQAATMQSARWMGDESWRDIEDLMQDQSLDQEVVQALVGEDPPKPGLSEHGAETRPNKSIRVYEIFFPEHGAIGTLAMAGRGGAWLRQPAPWYGPAEGPYVLGGAYPVPDSPYPLSVIAGGVAELDEAINAHAAAAGRAAAREKEIWVGDADPRYADALRTAPDGSIVNIPGIRDGSLQKVEMGGARTEQYEFINYLRGVLDRISGTSDASRGRIRNSTAHEAQIVDEREQSRADMVIGRFARCVETAIRRVGWYTFHDPQVAMMLEAPAEDGTKQSGWYMGGPQEDGTWLDYRDFDLSLEPFSLGRTDPQVMQQIAQRKLETLLVVAPAMAQFPFINWVNVLNEMGQAANSADWAETALLPGAIALLSQGQGLMPPAPATAEASPAL
jgi:hypothetical protein